MNKNSQMIKEMTGIAILGALVAILQLFIYIPIGEFTITFALIPIVVAAIIYGPKGGAFCGFVMGLIVILTNAGAFLAINPVATVFSCILKSSLAGLLAGYFYKWIKNKNLGCIVASVSAPIINTGIFAVCCFLFFIPGIKEWANGEGVDVVKYVFIYMIGANFLIELGVSIVLSPIVIRIVEIFKAKSPKKIK